MRQLPESNDELVERMMVDVADTVDDDYDTVDLLTVLADRCRDLLDVAATGVMLGTPAGDLRLISSSNDAMRLVELFELHAHEGPGSDCYRTGEPVLGVSLATTTRWPLFTHVALDAGFRVTEAIPLRQCRNVIGAVNLFHTDSSALSDDDVVVAQALADVATAAILLHDAGADAHVVNERLNRALQRVSTAFGAGTLDTSDPAGSDNCTGISS